MRIVLTLAVIAFSVCAATPARAFDFSDARRVVSIGDAQISPDGTRAVYVRGVADYEKDRTLRQIMLVDLRTRRSRALTYDRKGVAMPRWSPDGTSLAFLADDADEKNPQSQIFVLPMDGGEARQVTHAKNGVFNYSWSPDGSRFAYAMPDDAPDQKDVDAHRDAFQVHDNDYLHRAATPPVHAWIVGADGLHARRLTSGAWSIADVSPDGGGDLSWSADGRTLAITWFPTPFVGDSLTSTIELIDVASGRMRQLTTSRGLQNGPQFAPHGDALVYNRNTHGDYANGIALFVTHPGGGDGRDVRAGVDRNVGDYAWNAAGDAVWMTAHDGTNIGLWYAPVAGRARRIDTGDVQVSRLGNAARNGTIVFVATTPSHPAEVYVLNSAASRPVALTAENAFVRNVPIARSAGVDWTATKGRFHEDGVLTYPPGWKGGKTPLILLIHGGPQSASSIAWSTQRQIFASHGYLVFEPNYRGSTNLGDSYQHAIARDAGDGPGKDVMAGLAAVERMGIVDESRIGVSGWSYGGYMTSWLIGNYHVWKAAVSGASLDDWFDDFDIAFYVYTDVPFFGGVPWNPKYTAMWRSQSPIAYASQVTTPTLIMGDIGDNNVPITNSFKLYHALKDNGTAVQFVAYPVAGHFPSDPVRSEDVTRRWLGWLDRYLKVRG